jgi:hypothetical protein
VTYNQSRIVDLKQNNDLSCENQTGTKKPIKQVWPLLAGGPYLQVSLFLL